MEAKEVITRIKTTLQDILMPNINFVIQCVFEDRLVVLREYVKLKSISDPYDAATALVDTMILKGETTCKKFLCLLQDTKLTELFPLLKTNQQLNDQLKSDLESLQDNRNKYKNVAQKSEEEATEVPCKHPEELKLFCEEEQRAVCHLCDITHHTGHKLLPIGQAVNNLKDQLKPDLKSLKDKRNKYKEIEQKYSKVVQHNKKQVVTAARQIKAEIEKMHQFLREEEKTRLAALREEEEQKGDIVSREMKIIQEQISSLSDSISAVEQELQKPSVSFLSSYKHTQTSARVQCKLSEPQLVSGALIDAAKHLENLTFRVWEKMKEEVKFTPVILDPNTADDTLCLSEDLTSVRRAVTRQQLPDNPERNTKYSNVLGSEGFSSGKHSWEVEVGEHPDWNIGLAKESVDRKGKRNASPECGIWCLLQTSGEYTNGDGETLPLKRNPQRIRVQLDYDRGEVSFYDPEDMTHIYTHKDTFTEKLYPYFSIGKAGDATMLGIKVCQAETCLSVKI